MTRYQVKTSLSVGLLAAMMLLVAMRWIGVQPTCSGAPSPRLINGQTARVLPGDANDVYSQPASESEPVGRIPDGHDLIVLDGPICAAGQYWWRVSYEDVIGWTAEGRGSSYWLEPLTIVSVPTGTAQPSSTLTATPIPYASPTPTLHPALQRT